MATYNQVSYGSQGSDVRNLQELLNQNGYKLDVDGIFGSKTQAAVKDYQQKNNLDVDGIVGENTWGALTKASAGATTNQGTADTGFQYDAYQESDAVKQAQAMLQQQLNNKPGQYQSQWQAQLNDIINQILNKEKFSYDLNGDALYQQYKDQYTLQGKQAMMDTMGQAQAMTGGYGNSYAQTAGQQVYQDYLQGLNDKVPELYQLALSKYQMEGDEMQNQASILAQMEEQDYGRYRDQVADYNTELDRLQDQYNTERDYDYSKWADNRDFSYGQFVDDRTYEYQQGRDQVADQQWQTEFDEAVRQFNKKNGITSSSGSGSSSSTSVYTGGGGGGYDTHGYTTAQIKALQTAAGITADGVWGPNTEAAYQSGYRPTTEPAGNTDGFTGTTYSEAVAYLKNNGVPSANASAILTQGEWQRAHNSGSSRYGADQFDSYSEYLEYAVDANIAAYGK